MVTALEINPNNLEVLRILGGIYIDFYEELNDHAKGISYYEKILEIEPKNGPSWGGYYYLREMSIKEKNI
ncbi:MAG: tetratricopeptide repeat protein [Candidatus Heimdallarchaeota archaeon]